MHSSTSYPVAHVSSDPLRLSGVFSGSPSSSLLPERERALLGRGAESHQGQTSLPTLPALQMVLPSPEPGKGPRSPAALRDGIPMLTGMGSRCSPGTHTPANGTSTESSPCDAAGNEGAGRDGGYIPPAPLSLPARGEKSHCKTRRKKFGSICCSRETCGQRGRGVPQA